MKNSPGEKREAPQSPRSPGAEESIDTKRRRVQSPVPAPACPAADGGAADRPPDSAADSGEKEDTPACSPADVDTGEECSKGGFVVSPAEGTADEEKVAELEPAAPKPAAVPEKKKKYKNVYCMPVQPRAMSDDDIFSRKNKHVFFGKCPCCD